MGTFVEEYKFKNMEMELQRYKDYINTQNGYFKKKLEEKDEEHRNAMQDLILQKDREKSEFNEQLHNWIRQKDRTIEQQKAEISSLNGERQSLQKKATEYQQKEYDLKNKIDASNRRIQELEFGIRQSRDGHEAEKADLKTSLLQLKKQNEELTKKQDDCDYRQAAKIKVQEDKIRDLEKKLLERDHSEYDNKINKLEQQNKSLNRKIRDSIAENRETIKWIHVKLNNIKEDAQSNNQPEFNHAKVQNNLENIVDKISSSIGILVHGPI